MDIAGVVDEFCRATTWTFHGYGSLKDTIITPSMTIPQARVELGAHSKVGIRSSKLGFENPALEVSAECPLAGKAG